MLGNSVDGVSFFVACSWCMIRIFLLTLQCITKVSNESIF